MTRDLEAAMARVLERARGVQCPPDAPREFFPAPGVPYEFLEARLTDPPTGAIRSVAAFLAHGLPRECLILGGPVGRGKTWAMCAGLRVKGEVSRRFVHWPTFYRDWKSFGARGDRARDLLQDTRLLGFDDLGRERDEALPDAPDPVYDEVFSLLRALGRTVLGTTNLTSRRFFSLVTDRVASRFEGWGHFVVTTEDPDFRLRPEALKGLRA